MTVALDAVYPSSSGFWSTSQVSTGSWSHTCTGTNLLLIVDVGLGAHPDNALGVNASYGGKSMTLLSSLHPGGDNAGIQARFLLLNPSAGAHTVTVNVTGGKATIVGASYSFNGADQNTGVGTTYTGSGSNTNPTVSVATSTAGNIIVSAAISGRTGNGPGSGGTKRWLRNGSSAFDAGMGQGATWAATGGAVTTQFTLGTADDWAIISHEILSAPLGTVQLPTANLQLAAGSIGNQANFAQWWGYNYRQPTVFAADPPPLLPLQINVNNTQGQWLFALVSWRQDGGQVGTLQFPSTINVSDDAGNFWIPLQPGQHNTGIVRCSIWMAPAARAATTVTISPTSTTAGDAYQSSLFALIFETSANCPWYSVEETDFAFVNQGTSLTLSQQNTTTGLFTVALVATDNLAMPVNVTSGLGWGSLVTFGITNFFDTTGDLQQYGFVTTSAGSPLQVSISRASGTNVADLAGVMITVHGVSDTIPFPYTQPLEAWPTLITEIAAGPVINANPVMLQGTANWSVQPANFLTGQNATFDGGIGHWIGVNNCTVAPVTTPVYAGTGSLQMTSVAAGVMTAADDADQMPCTVGDTINVAAWVLAATSPRSCLMQVDFYTPGHAFSTTLSGTAATDSTSTWTLLTASITAPLTGFAAIKVQVQGTGAGGEIHYADTAFLNDGGTVQATGPGGTLATASWPVFQPYPNYQALDPPSIAITPSGQNATAQLVSEPEPVNTTLRYNVNAWVYVPVAGFTAIQPQIIWYDSSGVNQIQVDSGPVFSAGPGEWTNLTFPNGMFPPGNGAFASAAILLTSASAFIPSTPVVYVGYCGIGQADAYENTPFDDLVWSDVSSRNFTQGAIGISRGIQYEQQGLEAGTMTVTLVNSDGAIMFGNLLSTYWPNVGDTDVPIRLRAVWPQSVSPYYVLFSGFTDQIAFGWDQATWFGYAQIEATDAWSRMTTQMLDAGLQEVLQDTPIVFCPCSNSGANLAIANSTPMVTQVSNFGAGTATATFTSNAITLAGQSGGACWLSSGAGTSLASANQGFGLTYFPSPGSDLPPLTSTGMTASWLFTIDPGSQGLQPAAFLTIATCYSGTGPMWTLYIDNTSTPANTLAYITVYDQATGAGTTTTLGAFSPASVFTYLLAGTGTNPGNLLAASAEFTQTSLTVTVTVGAGQFFGFSNGVTVPVNFSSTVTGFSFGGNAGPLAANNAGGTLGFCNVAIANFAVFEGLLPYARLADQLRTAALAWPDELDTWRLARVLGYAGATPVIFQAQGLGQAGPPAADADGVTAITDTNGQVTSSYFTNIAASTLAFMFVNGPGTLIYRKRLRQYDRALPQWALGDNPANNLVSNPLNTSSSISPWRAFNNAVLTIGSVAGQALFTPFAGLLTGDGVTANPQAFYGFLGGFQGVPNIQPGTTYSMSATVLCPQGWAAGFQIFYTYFTSGFAGISSVGSPVLPLAAGSPTYLLAGGSQFFPGIGRAPSGAAFAFLGIAAIGTPPSNVQFFVSNVSFTAVPVVTAGGTTATVPFESASAQSGLVVSEVPYLIDATLSSDRALLFNQAVLNQFGTSSSTVFQGSQTVFQPTSGVLVTIQNTPSVVARAGVPYSATLYLSNTAQGSPYYFNEASIEDFGNWIVNTLAAPLLRPDRVTITPSSTVQALQMALQAEVGDACTFRRRPLGAPEVQVSTYISKLTHSIDIASGKWDVQYELSPYQAGTVLACDDAIFGPPTGGNLLGF